MVLLPYILLCSCSVDNDNLHLFGNLIPKIIKIDFSFMLHLFADFNVVLLDLKEIVMPWKFYWH